MMIVSKLLLFKKGGVTIVEEIDELVFSIIELQTKLKQDKSSPSIAKLQVLSTFFRIIISPFCHSSWRLVEPVCPGTECGPVACNIALL